MKVILRCMLALVAVFSCVLLLRDSTAVHAQTWSESCAALENTCISGGGGSACTTQYNSCLSQRQGACSEDSEQGCTVSYVDSSYSCKATCSCYGGCPTPAPACPSPHCDQLGGCSFAWVCDSPIVIDVLGKGFHLTNEANGVKFRFSGDQLKQVAWTDPRFGNGWLALDRNGNGKIDDATELFGNFTAQPPSPSPNGFLALGVYDLTENGGNGDGAITSADAIYSKLLVWTDLNHNGISEPNELQTLEQAGITRINLNYSEGHYQDEYGNMFRYRSHVAMASKDYDHLTYDVWLVGAN